MLHAKLSLNTQRQSSQSGLLDASPGASPQSTPRQGPADGFAAFQDLLPLPNPPVLAPEFLTPHSFAGSSPGSIAQAPGTPADTPAAAAAAPAPSPGGRAEAAASPAAASTPASVSGARLSDASRAALEECSQTVQVNEENCYDVRYDYSKMGVVLEPRFQWTGVATRVERTVVLKVVQSSYSDVAGVTEADRVAALNGRCVIGMSHAAVLEALRTAERPMVVTYERARPGEGSVLGECLTKVNISPTAPWRLTDWDEGYFVLRSHIAAEHVLLLFPSRAVYEDAVETVYRGEELPVEQQPQSYEIGPLYNVTPLRTKQYADGVVHWMVLKPPIVIGKPIKIGGRNLPELRRLHEAIRALSATPAPGGG